MIIKLRAIGDVILTTPVFRNLRAQFPGARIDFLVEQAASVLMEGDPDLDSVIVPPGAQERSLRKDMLFLHNLRRQQYEVCFDLFGNPRSAAIAFFSGARLRVGFDFRGRKYTYHIKIPSRADQIHEVEFHLDALRYFDIPVQDPYPAIQVKQGEIERAREIFAGMGLNHSPVIAFNPAGSWPAKRWPPSHFVALAHSLQGEYDARFLILWGPGEYQEAKMLAEKIGPSATVHPPTGLRDQAALLSLCQLFIGNDSGPMHLSAAVGTPTLGLYGPTHPMRQGPVGRRAKALFNPEIPCLGCDRLTCPLMDCMNFLTPEMVLQEVRAFIREGVIQPEEGLHA